MPDKIEDQLELLSTACREGDTAAALPLMHRCRQLAPALWPRIQSEALHPAAIFGHVDTCLALLKAGVDADSPNSFSQTALMLAADHLRLQACKVLIAHGANVNVANRLGESILFSMCNSHTQNEVHQAIAVQLIDAGADLGFIETSILSSCLHAAVSSQMGLVVQQLLARGAEVNAKNSGGFTPLHTAAIRKNTSLMLSLIHHGAHVDARNNHDETPMSMVNDSSYLDAILLLAAGAARVDSLDTRDPDRKDCLEGKTRLSASVFMGDARLLARTIEEDFEPLTLWQRLNEAIVENEALGKIQGPAIARSLLAARQARAVLAELSDGLHAPKSRAL